jgi:hypothetical protein
VPLPIQQQPIQQPPPMQVGHVPLSHPYQSLGYFTGFPEPIMYNAPKSQRNRRKSAPGLDHIKHRRTRSGCFTCRNRRVKVSYNPSSSLYVFQSMSDSMGQCDEARPICESTIFNLFPSVRRVADS